MRDVGAWGGLLLAFVAYALLAGLETALRSLNRLRLHHLSGTGWARAQALEAFLRPPRRTLSSVRMAGGLLRVLVLVLLASALTAGDLPGGALSGLGLAFAFALLGDAVPRTWFSWRPVDRLTQVLPLLRKVERLFRPLARWCGVNEALDCEEKRISAGPVMSRELLERLLRDGAADGAFSDAERAMMARTFALQTRRVREAMVPVERIVSVEAETTLAEFYAIARKHGFLRMPVRDRTTGRFVGVINVLYAANPGASDRDSVKPYMREPLFVPPEMSLVELLSRLRRNRQPMALVRGAGEESVLGLVTLDDVLAMVLVATPAPGA